MSIKTGIVLVGYGAPASDCPPYLLFKLKQLSARRYAMGGEPSEEEAELHAKIRTWPRTADNDAFKSGFEALADRLRSRLDEGVKVSIAYCEYCAPTLTQAVEALVQNDVRRIVVLPTMVVPRFDPAEGEIRQETERIRTKLPDIEFVYAWPFDLDAVAALLFGGFQSAAETRQPVSSWPEELKNAPNAR